MKSTYRPTTSPAIRHESANLAMSTSSHRPATVEAAETPPRPHSVSCLLSPDSCLLTPVSFLPHSVSCLQASANNWNFETNPMHACTLIKQLTLKQPARRDANPCQEQNKPDSQYHFTTPQSVPARGDSAPPPTAIAPSVRPLAFARLPVACSLKPVAFPPPAPAFCWTSIRDLIYSALRWSWRVAPP